MKHPGRGSTLTYWLAWLETLHPKKIDLGLSRVRDVLRKLSLDAPSYRIITVGGTNGKGSCVAYLSSIYTCAGIRVGAFTSPHLVEFNERITIDGSYASDDEIVSCFAAIDQARGEISLSYFEFSAIAALLHFARSEVDLAVLEVGMGGRLDAVNAVDSDAALIVSVALDHQEWLGQDREAIGYEKACIVRAGRPAVIADSQPPESLIRTVREREADARYIGKDFSFSSQDQALIVNSRGGRSQQIPKPAFGGIEQWINAAACVQVAESLQDMLPVSEKALRDGIASARPPGRADQRNIDGVEWLFDVAHNPAAARCLAEQLAAAPTAHHTWAIFGAMRDKDIPAMLRELVPLIDAWQLVSIDAERGATVDQMLASLREIDGSVNATTCADVAAACAFVRAKAAPRDRVVVCGSFYLVGPALSALELYSVLPGSAPQNLSQ